MRARTNSTVVVVLAASAIAAALVTVAFRPASRSSTAAAPPPAPTTASATVAAPVAVATPAAGIRGSAVVTTPSNDPLLAWGRLTLVGRAGSFGSVQPSADGSLDVLPVAGWQLLPGQAAYTTAVDDHGRVLMANEPQTDNQARATGNAMVLSVFDPLSRRMTNIALPTTTGATTTTSLQGPGFGGADIGDVQLIPGATGSRVALVSSAPYNGWNSVTDGLYPTLAVLNEKTAADGLGWSLDGAVLATADDLAHASTAGAAACDRRIEALGGPLADCGGFAEMGLLPRSQLLVATQYFGNPEQHRPGGLVVLDPAGSVVTTFDYPAPTDQAGRRLTVHPRQVVVDPTGVGDDERFVVVFDVDTVPVGAGGSTAPSFVAQEFRYRASDATIEAVSIPFVTGGSVGAAPTGIETAVFDSDGNLWVAESLSNTLTGGRLAMYRGGPSCGAGGTWGAVCQPDLVVDATIGTGLVRSLTADPARHRVVAVTTGGTIVAADAAGRVSQRTVPLNGLVDRYRYWIGPRQGAVDSARAALWVPIQQLQSPAVCAAYPCAPGVLDQWLLRVDLSSL